MLPEAEQVDPAFAREIFWRSLALRSPPLSGEDQEQHGLDFSIAFLALLLDRYDHDIAEAVLSPVREREASRQRNGIPPYTWVRLVSHRTDPDSTVRLAQNLLQEGADHADPPHAALVRRRIAAQLTSPAATNHEEDVALHEKSRSTVRSTLQIYLWQHEE